MKICVTGANGLLGSNVVRTLISRGDDVCALVRPGANLEGLEGIAKEIVSGDILDPGFLLEQTKGCDALIHVAANTSQWPTDLHQYQRVNIDLTKSIIEITLKNTIQRLVHVSTANCFGFGTKENPGTEASPYRFSTLKSGYITSKYIAQELILEAVRIRNLPAVVVNPTFMLGPYDAKPSSGTIIRMGMNKKIQVIPSGGKNFVDVRDAAQATCNAITMGEIGECYLLANENLSYSEFFEKVNRVCSQNPLQVTLPTFLLKSAGVVGSWVNTFSSRGVSLNRTNAYLLQIGNYYSGEKARRNLQMPHTSIEEAIQSAIEWWNR